MTNLLKHDIINNEQLLLRKNENTVRDKIIAHNLKLVKRIANKFNPDDEDIFSEGIIGLIKAVDKYDNDIGEKFSTYAYHCIRGAILDYYNRINYVHPNTFSANLPISDAEHGDLEFIDSIMDDYDFEDEIMQQDLHEFRKQFVYDVLDDKCSQRNKEVYLMYLNGVPKTEIKKTYDISRERIRQIISRTDELIQTRINGSLDESVHDQ